MISKDSLHIDWISKVSTANRKADKILVEKVIRALLLLEGLAKQNLDFVFKGGTALMLILKSSKRLSIDIDIIVEKEPQDLERLFENLLVDQGFTKFELQERKTGTNIQKAHYKFFTSQVTKRWQKKKVSYLTSFLKKWDIKKLKKSQLIQNSSSRKEIQLWSEYLQKKIYSETS